MGKIFEREELQAWDVFTIEHEPISSINLMERASIACVKRIIGSYFFQSVAIICGKGNNGGDGLAIARLLSKRGYKISVYICELSNNASADFTTNLKRLPKAVSVEYLVKDSELNFSADLLVDCIFGTGLNRPVTNWVGKVIACMNANPSPTVSVDLPSGLFAGKNLDNPRKYCVQADRTFTFQQAKWPFFFHEYAQYVGDFSVLNIDLLPNYEGDTIATYIGASEVNVQKRKLFSHKGNHGYLTVIASTDGTWGAALLCSVAGFRTGAGYVGLLSSKEVAKPLASRLPEAIWEGENFTDISKKTTAISIGPGLGQSNKSHKLLDKALEYGKPLVIDADAINLIAANENLRIKVPENSILTPHIGELKRLVGPADHPEQLLKKQLEFSVKHHVYIIQKGAFSKLTTPEGKIYINSTGNPSMASAGMGDVLTGVIGSFLAQGYSPLKAAINGMYFHGLAGDIAVRNNGEHGLISSDVIDALPEAFANF